MTKIIIRVLPDKHLQVIELLLNILSKPGIANIIYLEPLFQILLSQIADDSVIYRRQVRECLKKLNCVAKDITNYYNKKLMEIKP